MKPKLFDKLTARLTVLLFLFTAVTAFLLSLVKSVTYKRIEAAEVEKTESAMRSVLMAESYTPVEYTGGDPNVVNIYKAGDEGYVVECNVSGSQGMIGMVVGVDNSATVTGIGITSSSETSGLGANASAATEVGVNFREQFVGTAGDLAVKTDGGTIDALTGATVTSRAVTSGVNSAVAAVRELG